MTGILVSVLCAAAVGSGLATLMHQQKEAGLQHRLVLFDTKLTELTATVSMLTTMSTGTDTDTATATVTGSSSTNRRRLSGKAAFWDEAPTPNQNAISSQERLQAILKRQSDGLGNSMKLDEVEATPPSDNDLVCTPFRGWVLSGIFDNQFTRVDSNRSVRCLCSFVVG